MGLKRYSGGSSLRKKKTNSFFFPYYVLESHFTNFLLRKANVLLSPGPEDIKLFQCLTQLSMKFNLLINVVEIGHELISTVILLPSADPCKKGCCQLQAKVCARITG